MNHAEFLRSVEAFKSLSPAAAERLVQSSVVKTFPAGQTIIRRGDPGDAMYVIVSGSVRVPILDEQGRQSFLAQLSERQFFGEMALLTGDPRTADVVAQTNVSCVVIPRDALMALLPQHPDTASFLTAILGERLMALGGIRRVGKYRLVGELGFGGMAVVYEGVHPTLGRSVAVKMLSHELVYHEHFADRFRNEAKIIAGLRHPNIVEVYDTEEAYATFFIVMERLQGKDLERVMEGGRRLPFDQIRDLLVQLASALQYAHERGIVHRDLKPSNVFLEPDGKIKLTDFGLALVPKLEAELHVARNMSLGTPTYMAPEQAMAKPMDARADIYALGVVAYEMLTGTPPFVAPDAYTVMKKHVDVPVPSPRLVRPEIPADLDQFVLKACQKRPSERYQSCKEIIDFLSPKTAPVADPRAMGVATMTLVYAPDSEREVQTLVDEFRRRAALLRGVAVH